MMRAGIMIALLLAMLVSMTTTATSVSIPLPGATGTGPFTVAREWAVAFQSKFPEAHITLNGVGSGRAQAALWGDVDCQKRPVDSICDGNEPRTSTVWGIGDAPFSRSVYGEHPDLELQQLPAIAAGVVPIASSIPQLNLTVDLIAGIYAGRIKYWDDPALLEVNPSAASQNTLPHEPIRVVMRTDISGQNYIFTDGLRRNAPSWPNEAVGKRPDWPLTDQANEFTTQAWLSSNDMCTTEEADASEIEDIISYNAADLTASINATANRVATSHAYTVELADGMISAVLRIPWSIGYSTLELYNGFQDFFAEVRVSSLPLNQHQEARQLQSYEDNMWTQSFTTPGNKSIVSAMQNPRMDIQTMDIELAPAATSAYPLVGFGYWYFKKNHTAFDNCYQAWLVAKFIEWSYRDPQAAEIALKYGWVVPPASVSEAAIAKLWEIECLDVDLDSDSTKEARDAAKIITVMDYVPPRFYHDLSYINESVLAMGYALVAIVGFMSCGCAGFLYTNRKEWHVKVSQPEVLGVVVLGCFTSSLCIIFMGFQTGYRHLEDEDIVGMVDAGCMAVPWLYGVGFAMTFSMLFAKILRVKLIFQQANDHSRHGGDVDAPAKKKPKRIHFGDVWHIIAFMMVVEFGILISWQTISPLRWEREVLQEEHGLVIESVGECTSDHGYWFFAALVGFHVLSLLYALLLAIQTSHIDSSFAESKYISLSVAFMFQVLIMAVPIAALVRDNTTVYYLVRVLAVFLQNFTVLALLFIPKIRMVMKDGNATRSGNAIKKSKRASIKLSSLTNSKWDAGVDVINELLEEETDTYEAMTEEQRAELENVKVLLLERTDVKQSRAKYLPSQLLSRGTKHKGENTTQSERVDQATAAYIMREFGGVTVDDSSSMRSTDYWLSELEADPSDTGDENYLLPEFRELSREDQRKVCQMLSWGQMKKWGFNIFELRDLVGQKPLMYMGWAILGSPHSQQAMANACGYPEPSEGYSFADSELMIPMKTLCDYLRVIDDDYQDNPYHNSTHAADVLQSLHSLLQMESTLRPTKIELFAILLAAAVHDVDHPGVNNAFQANAKTDLSLIYHDKSVLENKHAAHTFLRMMGDAGTKQSAQVLGNGRINHGRESDLNVLCNAPPKDVQFIRSKVIDAIMHTDMSIHFAMVNAMKGLILGDTTNLACIGDDDRWQIMVYMMHMADISGQAKQDPLFLLWCERVMEEFFAQGDTETELGLPVSQLCDRKTTNMHESQIGFIEFVIKPSYEVLGDIIPEVKRFVLPIIQSNFDHFVKEKAKRHPKPLEQAIP